MFAPRTEDESLLRAPEDGNAQNSELKLSLPTFEYNENKNAVCINLPKSMGIEMSASLANIFGFGTNQLQLENQKQIKL